MRKMGRHLQVGDVLRHIHGRQHFQILGFGVTDWPYQRLALNNWGEGVYLGINDYYEVEVSDERA